MSRLTTSTVHSRLARSRRLCRATAKQLRRPPFNNASALAKIVPSVDGSGAAAVYPEALSAALDELASKAKDFADGLADLVQRWPLVRPYGSLTHRNILVPEVQEACIRIGEEFKYWRSPGFAATEVEHGGLLLYQPHEEYVAFCDVFAQVKVLHRMLPHLSHAMESGNAEIFPNTDQLQEIVWDIEAFLDKENMRFEYCNEAYSGVRLNECLLDLKTRLYEGVLPEIDDAAAGGETVVRRAKARPAERSWTQTDLNAAIQKYKANRASIYPQLLDNVRAGKPGAKKAARRVFGRNAIARNLGVKAKAMVSKSPEWRRISEELDLGNSRMRKKTGIETAIEDKAGSTSQPVVDQAIRRETIGIIRKKMESAEAEATIEKLQRGDISDDAAREIAEVVDRQVQDGRSRRAHQKL